MCVLPSPIGLVLKAGHLGSQDCPVPFGHPHVGAAVSRIGECISGSGSGLSPATLVLKQLAAVGELSIVGENCSTFPGVEIFAGLETKTAAEPPITDHLSFPLR